MTLLNQIHENDSGLKDPLFQPKKNSARGGRKVGRQYSVILVACFSILSCIQSTSKGKEHVRG